MVRFATYPPSSFGRGRKPGLSPSMIKIFLPCWITRCQLQYAGFSQKKESFRILTAKKQNFRKVLFCSKIFWWAFNNANCGARLHKIMLLIASKRQNMASWNKCPLFLDSHTSQLQLKNFQNLQNFPQSRDGFSLTTLMNKTRVTAESGGNSTGGRREEGKRAEWVTSLRETHALPPEAVSEVGKGDKGGRGRNSQFSLHRLSFF